MRGRARAGLCLAVLGLCGVSGVVRAQALGDQDERIEPQARERETWAIELGIGLGSDHSDAYTERVESFGFGALDELSSGRALRLSAAFAYQLSEHFSVVVEARNLEQRSFRRDLQKTGDTRRLEDFSWNAYALVPQLRAHVDVFGEQLRLYGQLGPGLGFARSDFDGYGEDHFGVVVAYAVGAFYMPSWFGVLLQLGYAYAPIVDNLLDDTHDCGGVAVTVGVRFRGWGGP